MIISSHLFGVELTEIPYFKEGYFLGNSETKYIDGKKIVTNGIALKHYKTSKNKFFISETQMIREGKLVNLKMKISLIPNKDGNYDYVFSSERFNGDGYIKVISKNEYHTFSYQHSNKMISETLFNKETKNLSINSTYMNEKMVIMNTKSSYKYSQNETLK